MQEIRSSKPPVVTGICDPNKSGARHHRRYLVLETDEANCETMKKRRHRLKTQLLNDSRKNGIACFFTIPKCQNILFWCHFTLKNMSAISVFMFFY